VGAHQFRNHFGWYMQRAAAGEEILVTRRGKPCVRLIRAAHEPTLSADPVPDGGRTDPPSPLTAS